MGRRLDEMARLVEVLPQPVAEGALDAIDGDVGQLNLAPKSRESVTLKFACDVPFTELKPYFRWAPVGFTRP